MGFNTKIQIDDQHVVQGVGTTLTLSGDTRYAEHPTFTGDTQVIDKKYVDDNIVSGVTGGSIYNLLSPAAVEVGGITVGTVLTGKSSNEIIQDMLFPEICGTLTNPSTQTTDNAGALYEIGCSIGFNITSTFNPGSIDPQGCSASPDRSGDPNSYCFTGAQIAGTYACTTSPVVQAVTAYSVLTGVQSWGSCVSYDAGVQPKSNKDNNFDAPLAAGTTSASSVSTTGAYPVYGTSSAIATLTKQTLVPMTNNCVTVSLVTETGGNKQKFEVACGWLGAPTNRPLVAIEQYNTVSSAWECPGGSAATSLALWDKTAATETVQSVSVGYCQYTFNSTDRDAVDIRLKFA